MTALQADWVAPARTALLVIDIQRDFAAPDGAMAQDGADLTAILAAVTQAEALVAAARTAGITVIFTRSVVDHESDYDKEVQARQGNEGPSLVRAGTPGADFVGPLPQGDEAVITKPRYNVFAGTGLAERLRGQGIDTLVLCGLTTECCVQSSTWDAFERDFHVLIAADAVAAYQDDLHQAALRSLELSGAQITSVAALCQAWK